MAGKNLENALKGTNRRIFPEQFSKVIELNERNGLNSEATESQWPTKHANETLIYNKEILKFSTRRNFYSRWVKNRTEFTW